MSTHAKVKIGVGFVGCILLTIPWAFLLAFISNTFHLDWKENIGLVALILGFASGFLIQWALDKYVNK
jgi:hypothetical protein